MDTREKYIDKGLNEITQTMDDLRKLEETHNKK